MMISAGSGNGLVSSRHKLLPQPMLTPFYVATWRHQAKTINANKYWPNHPKNTSPLKL